MNQAQKLFMKWTLIGFAFGLTIGFCIGKASAADLIPPCPLMQTGRSPVCMPEPCLIDGKNGLPNQTLVVDKSCKTGLRWKNQGR